MIMSKARNVICIQGSYETPETGTWFHGVTGSGIWLKLGSQERGVP